MEIIKKWAVSYYLWIMLGFSILGMGFATVLVYEVYQLMTLQEEAFSQKTFRIISKPKEESLKKDLLREKIRMNIEPGDTIQDIGERLETSGILPSKDEFFTYLKRNKINLEGIVFEGEYDLPTPTSPEEVSRILMKSYEAWIKNDYAKHKDIGKTPLEVITIASMIEKEAAEDEERPVIAGVIYNRLKSKMKLQIDATVIYALGEHKSRLSYEDLKVESPYNTYIIKGLPPGPICVPRKASIDAALNPSSHSYFYYVVSSYGSKRHFFAKTYDEHLQNVAKYKETIN